MMANSPALMKQRDLTGRAKAMQASDAVRRAAAEVKAE